MSFPRKELDDLKQTKACLSERTSPVKISMEESSIGIIVAELEEMNRKVNHYHSEYETYKKSINAQHAKDKRDTIVISIFSAVTGSVVGGIVVYYWPCILDLPSIPPSGYFPAPAGSQ